MKKIISLMLVACLLINTAFAIDFTDFDKAKWAEPFIRKIADLGIVAGYADGTYRPLDDVTSHVATLVMFRIIKSLGLVDMTQVEQTKEKYASVLVKYNVPQWPDLHEAIAMFLDQGVFTLDELSKFMTNGLHNTINKQDFSRFYGKVLNLYLKDDVNQIIKYSPKDVNKINFESLKYINILNKRAIISGDDQGNFNPEQTLNRAVLAKLLATGIDVLEAEAVSKAVTVNGTILALLDGKKLAVSIVDSSNQSIVEAIDDTVVVKVGDLVGTYSDLQVDDAVTLLYKGTKLIEVQVPFSMKHVVETEVEISSTIKFNGKQYIYVRALDATDIKFYELTQNATVTKAGLASTIDAMQKGDRGVIGMLGGKVVSVSFDSKTKSVTGIFKGINIENEPLVNVLVNDEIKHYPVMTTAVMKRNDQFAKLNYLMIGDEVMLTTVYNVISELTAKGPQAQAKGTISAIKLGDVNEVVIKMDDNTDKTYLITSDTNVTIDGQVATMYDLRTNYTVSVQSNDKNLTLIKATTSQSKTHVVGNVETVYKDLGIIQLKVNDAFTTINVSSSSMLLDSKGEKTTLTSLEKGQKVFVYGKIEENIIFAEKFIILE